MGFNVSERRISRRVELGTQNNIVEVRYVLRYNGSGGDGQDDQAAYSAFVGALPATWTIPTGLLYFDSATVDEEDAGSGIWNGFARYVPNTIQLVIGQERRAFNSSGGTQHFTVSRETTSSTGSSPPNFKQLINVSEDSPPAGADVFVGIHEFEIVRAFASGSVDEDAIAVTTGTLNDSTFYGYGEGRVLFLGATGAARSDGVEEITFRFAVQQDRSGVVIGDLTVSDVLAWELLWVYYTKADVGGGVIGDVPTYAYTERMYDEANFDVLGLNG